jgi:hypothetical protein
MIRRSPLLSAYAPSAFELGEVYGMQIALRATAQGLQSNFLADLSALRRRLFIGAGAAQWLDQHDIPTPVRLLEYTELDEGAIIVRLHRQQYLLVDGVQNSSYDALLDLPESRDDNVLILAHEAAEIACGGPHVAAVMAEFCAMDLGTVGENVWLPTRFAHCEVALRRVDFPAHYRIVCSPADARFLFGVLEEVTLERGGVIVGFDDFHALANWEDETS